MFRPLVTVFRQPRFITIALSAALGMYLLTGFLSQVGILLPLLTWSAIPPTDKVALISETALMWPARAGLVETIVSIMAFTVIGLNIGLLVFFRQRSDQHRSSGTGVGAIVLSWLGVGCGSCGSLLLFSIFGTAASAALIELLPFQGKEVGLLALALGLIAHIRLLRTIAQSDRCQIMRLHRGNTL